MGVKLDQQSIQRINIFSKITRVRAQDCFIYNNSVFYVVRPGLLPKAIGEKGNNIKRLSLLLRTKVRVIPTSDMEMFVKNLVQPVKFKRFVTSDGQITIFAGQQAKASLIGRNKVRLNELSEVLKRYFGTKIVKIV